MLAGVADFAGGVYNACGYGSEVLMDNFNYNDIRAKKARFGNIVNKPVLKFTGVLITVLAILGAAYLLVVARNSAGWILVGIADVVFVFMVYAKAELYKVPSGKTESLNDILSHNILAHLDATPTPREIAQIVQYTRSGKFMIYRFGLSTEILDFVAANMSGDPTPVFQKAREIRAKLNAPQVSGGILAVALIECFPDYENLLARMRLSLDDLYAGVRWYNYLYGVVENQKRKRHTGGIARDFAFGYIPTLSQFGHNISAELSGAASKQIRLAAHEEVVSQMIETFAGGGRQNVALIGPAGSGKTTIVDAFAQRIMDADSSTPGNLRFRQVFMLDATAIISAAGGPGEVEGLVDRILGEAYSAQNIIIYLHNAHLFFEQGVGSVDISNLLIPTLEAGRLRIIMTMDEQRFLEISAVKPALSNALNKIMVNPASEDEAMRVMEDQVPILEFRYKVVYTFLALREAYRLSERYVHDLEMPGRALNLLEASAKFATSGFVLAESVQKAVEATTGVKVSIAGSGADSTANAEEERQRLLNMEALIHQRMVDQEEAVRTISDALRRSAAGVRNTARPIGTFLFLGPTGVGKTELAKAVSEVYFGGEGQMVRIDLNEYVGAEDVSRLIADGAEDPMSLTAQIMKQPFSVVLLDEIEKAHPSVLTTLLQMLDEGVLRDIRGREISFRDAIIVATSNAGAEVIRDAVAKGVEFNKEALTSSLISSGQFRPEFLNRFDEICVFKPLGMAELSQVLDLIIAGVNKTLAPQKISVSIDEGARAVLVSAGYDPQLGARPMRRIVQKTVENLVAKSVLAGTASAGAAIVITKEMVEGELGTQGSGAS